MPSCQARVLPEHLTMRWVPAAHGTSYLRLSCCRCISSTWASAILRGFQGYHQCSRGEAKEEKMSNTYTLGQAEQHQVPAFRQPQHLSSQAAPTSYSSSSPSATCQHCWPWKIPLWAKTGTDNARMRTTQHHQSREPNALADTWKTPYSLCWEPWRSGWEQVKLSSGFNGQILTTSWAVPLFTISRATLV